jgi:hypothetical protein
MHYRRRLGYKGGFGPLIRIHSRAILLEAHKKEKRALLLRLQLLIFLLQGALKK